MSMTLTAFRLSSKTKKELKQLSKEVGVSQAVLVRLAIDEYIWKHYHLNGRRGHYEALHVNKAAKR